MKKVSLLLCLLMLGVGQMWATTPDFTITASSSQISDWNKTYSTEGVVLSYSGVTALGEQKVCGASSKTNTFCVNTSNSQYLEVGLPSTSSKQIAKVVLRLTGNSTGSSSYSVPLFYCNEKTFDANKVEGYKSPTCKGYDQSCTDNEITFDDGVKSFRIYKQAKYTAPTSSGHDGKVGAGTNTPSSSSTWHLAYMEIYLEDASGSTTYTINYSLNSGTHGTNHPTSATVGTAFAVSAPTRSNYTFTGWTVTSNLNTSTAKWGTSSSSVSTSISSSSTKCINGTSDVYFKDLRNTSGPVTLTANWTAITLSSISVKTAPTKTTYTAGEYFNPAGLVITKTMSDNSKVDVAYADESSNFSFSPTTSTALTTSNNTVRITYGGKYVDQTITVNAPLSPTPCGQTGHIYAYNDATRIQDGAYRNAFGNSVSGDTQLDGDLPNISITGVEKVTLTKCTAEVKSDYPHIKAYIKAKTGEGEINVKLSTGYTGTLTIYFGAYSSSNNTTVTNAANGKTATSDKKSAETAGDYTSKTIALVGGDNKLTFSGNNAYISHMDVVVNTSAKYHIFICPKDVWGSEADNVYINYEKTDGTWTSGKQEMTLTGFTDAGKKVFGYEMDHNPNTTIKTLQFFNSSSGSAYGASNWGNSNDHVYHGYQDKTHKWTDIPAPNNASAVYLVGSFNSWTNADPNYALTKVDANHWTGSFFLNGASSNYEFKVYAVDQPTGWGYQFSANGFYFGSNTKATQLWSNNNNDQIVPLGESGKFAIDVEYYGQCDNHGQLTVTRAAVHTVSFAKGNSSATGTEPTSVEVAEGKKTILPANPFTLAGSTFAGWNDGTNTYQAGAEYTMGSSDKTLTAQWALIDPGTVTITSANDQYLFWPGDAMTLTATPTGVYSGFTYQWKKNGTAIDGATNNTYSVAQCAYSDAGKYTCTVTNNSGSPAVSKTSAEYQTKTLHFYLKDKDGTDISGKNYDFVSTDVTNKKCTVTVTGMTENTTYKFSITDGENCGVYGNSNKDATMKSYDCTNWQLYNHANTTIVTDHQGDYVFELNYSNWQDVRLSVVYPTSDQAKDKVIYFDNSTLQWETPYYRIGRGNHNTGTAMTKVKGTANLYKITTAAYNGFLSWHICNNLGTAGDNSVYKTTDDSKAITKSLSYVKAPVTAEITYASDGNSCSQGADAINSNCCFYGNTTHDGMYSHTATITAPTNGTITVAYKDTTDAAQSFTSGNKSLAHTCILTITPAGATGYEVDKFYVNDVETTLTNGKYEHILSANATFKATFKAKKYTVTLNNQSATTAGATSVEATYGEAMPSIASNLPAKTGHNFLGYFDAASSGTKYINADGTSAKNWNKTTANPTLYAHWDEIKVTKLELSKTTFDLKVGTYEDVTLTITPADAYNKDIDYSSSKANNVTITIVDGKYRMTASDEEWEKGGKFKNTNSSTVVEYTFSSYYEIVYNTKGGSSISSQKYYSSTHKTFEKPADPTKDNCEFAGWYETEDCSGSEFTSFSGSPGKNLTLYAKWNAAKTTPEVTWTTVPSTVYPGGKYQVVVSTTSDATLTDDNVLTTTVGSFTTKSVSGKIITATLAIPADAASAPSLKLTTAATSAYTAKEDTYSGTISLGTCGGGVETLFDAYLNKEKTNEHITSTPEDALNNLDNSFTGSAVELPASGSNKRPFWYLSGSGVVNLTLSKKLQAGDVLTFDCAGYNQSTELVTGIEVSASNSFTNSVSINHTFNNTQEVSALTCTIAENSVLISDAKTLYFKRINKPIGFHRLTITRNSGSGGSKQTPTLTWSENVSSGKTITAGQSVTITASATSIGAMTYSVEGGTGISINSSTGEVTTTASATGPATVKATVAEVGCFNSANTTYTLTVNPACTAPTNPTISGYSGDAGSNLTLTATATGTDENTTYTWYKTDKTGSPIQAESTSGHTYAITPVHYTDHNGQTYICVISNGTSCTADAEATLSISRIASPTLTASATSTSLKLVSSSATTTVSSTGGNGGTVTYKVYTNSKCTAEVASTTAKVESTTFTATTVGTYYLRAEQPANGDYLAANSAAVSIAVTAAQTYTINYNLNSGSIASGKKKPTTGIIDQDVEVDAPTRDGYEFAGWTISQGLNTSSAFWGTTSANIALKDAATFCRNDNTPGSVFFRNLCAANQSVTLFARWKQNCSGGGTQVCNEYVMMWKNTDLYDGTKSGSYTYTYTPASTHESYLTLSFTQAAGKTSDLAQESKDASLNTGKWEGNTFTFTPVASGAKITKVRYYGKISGKAEYSKDGTNWKELSKHDEAAKTIDLTNGTQFSIRNKDDGDGTVEKHSGVWIRNMEITICTGGTGGTCYYLTYCGTSNKAEATSGATYDFEAHTSTSVTLKQNEFTVPTGFTFGGWNTKQDGSGTTYSEGASYTIDQESDTVYAVWIPQYKLTYDANEGTGTVPAEATYAENAQVTVAASTGLSKDGFKFKHWNTNADGTGTAYAAGNQFSITSNMRLYAIWEATETTVTQTYVWNLGYNTCSTSTKPSALATTQTYMTVTSTAGSSAYSTGSHYTTGKDNGNTITFSTAGGMLITAACIYGKVESGSYARSYNGGVTWDTISGVSTTDADITITIPTGGVSSIMLRNISENSDEGIYLRNAHFTLEQNKCTTPAIKTLACAASQVCKGEKATLTIAHIEANTTYYLKKDGEIVVTSAQSGVAGATLSWQVAEAGTYTAGAYAGTDNTKTSCLSSMTGTVTVAIYDATISGNKTIAKGGKVTLHAATVGGEWSVTDGSENATIDASTGELSVDDDATITSVTVEYTIGTCTGTYTLQVTATDCNDYFYYSRTEDGSTNETVFTKHQGHTVTTFDQVTWVADASHTFKYSGISTAAADTMAVFVIPQGQKGTLYMAAKSSSTSRRNINIDAVAQSQYLTGAETIEHIIISNIASGTHAIWSPSGSAHVAMMCLQLCNLPEATKYNFTTNKTELCTGDEFTLTLSGSQQGCRYQLYRNDILAVGAPVSGTGSAITWHYTDLPEPTCSYKVVVLEDETHAQTLMNGTPTIQSVRSIIESISEDMSVTTGQSATLQCEVKTFYPKGNETYTLQWYSCNADGSNPTALGSSISITSSGESSKTSTFQKTVTNLSADTYYYKVVITDKCSQTTTSSVVRVTASGANSFTWTLDGGAITTQLYQGSQHKATVTANEIAPSVEIGGVGAEIISTTISGTTTTVVFNLASNAKDVTLTASTEATATYSASSETKDLDVDACSTGGADYYVGQFKTTSKGAQTVTPTTAGGMWVYGTEMAGSTSKNNKKYYKFKADTKVSCHWNTSNQANKFAEGGKIEFICISGAGNQNDQESGVTIYKDSACTQKVVDLDATLYYKTETVIEYTIPNGSTLIGQSAIYFKAYDTNMAMREIHMTAAPQQQQQQGDIPYQNTSLIWSNSQASGTTITKVSGAAPFTITAAQPNSEVKSLGAITYTSSSTSVATVDSKTGKVTLGNTTGNTTITATLAAYGCYQSSTTNYIVSVTSCGDQAGSIAIVSGGDIACGGNPTTLRFSGYASGATIKWYRNDTEISGETGADITVTQAGEYYAIAHGTCDKASSNTITLRDASHLTATAIVDYFYVRKDMPMAPVPLYELPEGVTYKSANLGALTGDCKMLQKGNIVYLDGKATAAAGDYNISIVVDNTCEEKTSATIKITVQESLKGDGGKIDWTKCKVAFVVTGTAHGGWTAGVQASQSTNLSLFKYLDIYYDITAVNGYNSSKKKEIMEYYSQYDMIILTDYLNTKTVDKSNGNMSYSNAVGYMIDIRPVLSFEAFAAGLSNWHIDSNPESPKGIQRQLKLLCNAHDIFGTPDDPEGEFKADDIVQITTYEGDQKEGRTGLQGFRYQNAPNYVSIATIPMRDGAPEDSVLITCCERQEEIEARMMIFGLNAAAMETITQDGNKIVHNLVNYMLIKEPADLPDCAIVFTGAALKSGQNANWSNLNNWEGSKLPTMLQPVRIDSVCVVDITSAKAGYVKINHKPVGLQGKARVATLTIQPTGALTVNSYIREMDAENPMPHVMTSTSYVSVLANSANTGALVVDNTEGDLKAQVQMYTKSNIEQSGTINWQYVGTPFNDVLDARENYLYSYLYSWNSANNGWSAVANGAAMEPFLGYIITQTNPKTYDMSGTLVTTANQDLTVVKDVYNVFANSWTAPINISQFEEKDFEGITNQTIYMFNTGHDENRSGATGTAQTAPGTYLTLPIKASSYMTEMKEIPAMAGFFVKGGSSNGTLHLNYDRLVRPTYSGSVETKPMLAPGRGAAQETSFYGEPVVMQLIARSEQTQDKVYLMQRADFTTSYDSGWDGEQKDNNSYAAQLYAVTNMGAQAVAAIPELDGTIIGFRAGNDSEYTFSFVYDGYATPLYLFDSETNVYTRILTGNTYTFQTVDKAKHNRFLITSYSGQEIGTGNQDIHSVEEGAKKIILDEHFYIYNHGVLYDGQGKLVK